LSTLYEKKEYALQYIVYYNRITDLKKSPFKLVEQNKRFKKCIQRGPKKFILQGEFKKKKYLQAKAKLAYFAGVKSYLPFI
jgi:hypothetical protein